MACGGEPLYVRTVHSLREFIHIILHLNEYLDAWSASLGAGMYVLLFLVVFCETGLVVTPFLPGDSLLFACGVLAASPKSGINLGLLIAVLLVALSPLWRGWFDPSRATLDNFRYVLEEFDLTQHAIFNSAVLSGLGATIIVALGFLQAYRLQSRLGWMAKVLQPVLSMPNGIPGIIFGLGILILLIRTPLYGTYWIILIAYVAHYFPFAMRSLGAVLMSLSPELEQSARASGASWWQTLRIVVIPLTRPGLIATWLMLFIILLRELGSTILLYGQGTETIGVAMLLLSEQNFHYVAALAIVQVALLGIAFALLSRNSKSLFQ